MMQRARHFVLVFGVFLFLGVLALTGRLAWLTVGTQEQSEARMDRQSNRMADVEACRGALLDRHGRVLASSVQTLRAEVLPRNFLRRAKTLEEQADLVSDAAAFLAPLVRSDPRELERRLSGSKWTVLGEPIQDPLDLDTLEAERRGLLYGLDFVSGYTRRYPWGSAAGNLIGYVNHEGVGVAGLEAGLDDLLRGADGVRRYRVDHLGREVSDRTAIQVPAVDGMDVTLTLDARIQQIVEEEALAARARTGAVSVTVVAMEPSSGDVLAMCSVPGIDLSDRQDRPQDGSVCAALQEVYPPGSTFKPLMMAAAMELGLVDPEGPPVDCRAFNGPRRIRDTHPKSEPLSVEEIIVHSSNIGMANILTRLVPADRPSDSAAMRPLQEIFEHLGLGRKTGLPVPAEASGLVTKWSDWTRTYTLASVAFGQELGVSAVQMAAAASSLYDGLYRPPRLVAACTDASGEVGGISEGPRTHVFQPDIVRQVRQYMARSVDEGSCESMKLPGVRVAGKTGTAQCENKPGAEVHSYLALAPSEKPVVTLVVVVREPQGVRYASESAAPAAGAMLMRLLPYMGIPLEEGE